MNFSTRADSHATQGDRPAPVRRVGRGSRPHRAEERGFTLMEMMVAAAMIGVLAAIAVVGYIKYVDWAQVANTKDLIAMLTMGQEGYYSDTRGYLDCSSDWTDGELYPRVPNGRKHTFHDPAHGDFPCWRLLNPEVSEPTYMSFWTRADEANTLFEPLPAGMAKGTIDVAPRPDKPWYIVIGVGNQDEDGIRSYFMAHSAQPGQLHIENEDE